MIAPVRPGLWSHMVDMYFGLKLTYQSDCLPALSAVAEMSSAQLGEENYLAGLWRNALPSALLWELCRHEKYRNGHPSTQPLAPTWSWASFSSEIQDTSAMLAHGCLADQGVEIVHCKIQLAHPGVKYGAVKRRELVVGGRLSPVGLCLEDDAITYSENFNHPLDLVSGVGRTDSVKKRTQVQHDGSDLTTKRGLHRIRYKHPMKAYQDHKLAALVSLDRRETVAGEMIRASKRPIRLTNRIQA